jgi:hypothetical protein
MFVRETKRVWIRKGQEWGVMILAKHSTAANVKGYMLSRNGGAAGVSLVKDSGSLYINIRIVVRINLSNEATAYLYWRDSQRRSRKWHGRFACLRCTLITRFTVASSFTSCSSRVKTGSQIQRPGHAMPACYRGKQTSPYVKRDVRPSFGQAPSHFHHLHHSLHPKPSIHRSCSQRRRQKYYLSTDLKVHPVIHAYRAACGPIQVPSLTAWQCT